MDPRGRRRPELVDVGTVEAGFFDFFGVAPRLGRGFRTSDDAPGAAPVVMLSHRLWERRFGGDPSIIGNVIEVAGTRMEVVGVVPASFRLHLPSEAFRLRDAELWTPLRLDPGRQPPRNFTGYTAFVRLAPDVTFAHAQQELDVMATRLRSEHAEHASSKLVARVVPLQEDVVKGAEPMLVFLLGATGFVLLIACANVTNLVIVRNSGRAEEFALRMALGADRAALARLSVLEGFLLAAAGSVLGLGLANLGVDAMRTMAATSVPMLDAVTFDGRVLAFTGGAALLSACVVGLLPAIRVPGRRPGGPIATHGASRRHRRFRNALVVGEVAASLVLLVGTGLMIRSFVALGTVDPGFDLEDALTMRISLPAGSFDTPEEREAVRRRLVEEIEALPGVRAAATIDQLPLTGSGALQPYAYDEETAANWESVTADQRHVSIGFFDAIGARLVEGRDFVPSEVSERNPIIIDDRLARQAFPEGEAIGGRLQVNPANFPENIRYAHVVGVVEHLRLHDLARPRLTQIWYPDFGGARFSLLVKTDGDALTVAPAVRDVIGRLAPGTPLQDVRTLAHHAGASLAPLRLTLTVMAVFGGVALVLACIGLYGVLSSLIGQRTHEIGVRMALGQSRAAVRRQVFGDTARLVVAAMGVGLLVAAGLARVASTLVYGVSVFDPATYLATALVLALAAALACWMPARRATRIDPREALRAVP